LKKYEELPKQLKYNVHGTV